MVNKERFNKSADLVVAAFIGGYTSRILDKALALDFPFDIIIILLTAVIFTAIVYWYTSK